MRKIIIITILFLTTYNISGATDNKRQLVEELIILTNVEASIDAIFSQMGNMMKGTEQQLGIKPEEKEFFNNYMSKVNSLIREEINWESIKNPTIDIYIKHYTEQELKDIVVFYKTESGKSMIKKMPLVVQDSMAISQSLMKQIFPKLRKLSEEMQTELFEARKSVE